MTTIVVFWAAQVTTNVASVPPGYYIRVTPWLVAIAVLLVLFSALGLWIEVGVAWIEFSAWRARREFGPPGPRPAPKPAPAPPGHKPDHLQQPDRIALPTSAPLAGGQTIGFSDCPAPRLTEMVCLVCAGKQWREWPRDGEVLRCPDPCGGALAIFPRPVAR